MSITITTLHSTRPDKLTVVPTFRDLLPTMPEEHWDEFVSSVRTDGVREAVVVWDRRPDKQGLVVVDGHNRLAAAIEAGAESIPVRMIDFVSEQQALQWALRANVTRRHLTPQQMSELRGRLYESEKSSRGGDRRSNRQNVGLKTETPSEGSVAANVAKETGVEPRTVERDAAYVRDLDKLRPDLKEEARSGKLTKTDVRILAAYSDDAQAEIAEIAEQGKVSIAVAAEQYEAGNEVAEPAAEVTPAERARSDMEAANETLSDWCKQLRAIGRQVPLSHWLTESQAELIRADIAKAARQAIHNVGHDLCPHCNGAGCGYCHSAGWMPKDAHAKALRQLEASSK